MRDMKTAVKYHRYNSIGCSGVSALATVCSLCVGCSQEDRDDAISRTAGAARELNGGNGTGCQMSFENKEGCFLLRENGVRNGLSRTLVT